MGTRYRDCPFPTRSQTRQTFAEAPSQRPQAGRSIGHRGAQLPLEGIRDPRAVDSRKARQQIWRVMVPRTLLTDMLIGHTGASPPGRKIEPRIATRSGINDRSGSGHEPSCSNRSPPGQRRPFHLSAYVHWISLSAGSWSRSFFRPGPLLSASLSAWCSLPQPRPSFPSLGVLFFDFDIASAASRFTLWAKFASFANPNHSQWSESITTTLLGSGGGGLRLTIPPC